MDDPRNATDPDGARTLRVLVAATIETDATDEAVRLVLTDDLRDSGYDVETIHVAEASPKETHGRGDSFRIECRDGSVLTGERLGDGSWALQGGADTDLDVMETHTDAHAAWRSALAWARARAA